MRHTFVILILLLVSTAVSAQKVVDPLALFDEKKVWYNGYGEAWFNFFDIPEKDVRESIVKWELISRDLSSSDSTVPRTFGMGDPTHGSLLRWSQADGFVLLHVDFCAGGPTAIIRGRAEATSDSLTLIPEVSLGNTSMHGDHEAHSKMSFLVIRWLNSTYLVKPDDLKEFSEYTAGLAAYNSEFAYMDAPFLANSSNEPESSSSRTSLPIYPKGYERFLLRPIRGSVMSIGRAVRRLDPDSDDYDQLVTRIRIKIEHPENLRRGLYLHPVGADQGFGEKFKIRSFKNNIADVDQMRSVPKRSCGTSGEDNCNVPEHTALRLGLKLSSNGQ